MSNACKQPTGCIWKLGGAATRRFIYCDICARIIAINDLLDAYVKVHGATRMIDELLGAYVKVHGEMDP